MSCTNHLGANSVAPLSSYGYVWIMGAAIKQEKKRGRETEGEKRDKICR